jgi:hypothetical protein
VPVTFHSAAVVVILLRSAGLGLLERYDKFGFPLRLAWLRRTGIGNSGFEQIFNTAGWGPRLQFLAPTPWNSIICYIPCYRGTIWCPIGIVMSGRRPLIKGYFQRCAGRGCGHVFGLLRGV